MPNLKKRLDRLEFTRSEMPQFRLDVAHNVSVILTTADIDKYLVKFCATASSTDEKLVRKELERITMRRSGRKLIVRKPFTATTQPSHADVHVLAPRERSVSIKGAYSYIEIVDVGGSVDVATTHARLKLLNTSGRVDAKAKQGIVDFGGKQGKVNLWASWEINLKITSEVFRGTLRAIAGGPIRVLIPANFITSFEATVRRSEDFICRTEFRSRITNYDTAGRVVFRFGDGSPVLRFVSTEGPVIIDEINDLTPVLSR